MQQQIIKDKESTMQNNSFTPELSKLSTVPQATERYKISRKSLMKYAEIAGAIVRFGKSVRINIDKMDSFVDEQATNNRISRKE